MGEMKPFTQLTTVEVAEMLKIKPRSARSKMLLLAKQGKVTRVAKGVGAHNPGVYQLNIPLRDLFMTIEDVKNLKKGKTIMKHFCADPFNLAKGAR